jgi:hypothetical protein
MKLCTKKLAASSTKQQTGSALSAQSQVDEVLTDEETWKATAYVMSISHRSK